jgi:site-specific DNA-methyltransferase (adenine-specific)
VKPYFERGGITILHGDAREIVPSLKADVLVTDPPYGVKFSGKVTKHTASGSGGYTIQDDADIGPEVVRVALPLVVRGAVFSGNRNLMAYPLPADIGCVFCPSGAGVGPWGFVGFHPVLFYGKRPGSCQPTSIQSFDTVEKLGHPCPKPIRWMRWIVALTSLHGETILDPFAGSGTTLRAAMDLGRRAVGIEIEERYCEIAASRLLQDTLFTATEIEPVLREQCSLTDLMRPTA